MRLFDMFNIGDCEKLMRMFGFDDFLLDSLDV